MKTELQAWLTKYFGTTSFVCDPLAGDASFRLYFRVKCNNKSYVVMDATAEREKCAQFVAIAKGLRARGLMTPEVFAEDCAVGFLLLSDFGDNLYLKVLSQENADVLYDRALDALAVLAQTKAIPGYTVPPFTQEFMRLELDWFQEWFLEKYLALELTEQVKKKLANTYDVLTTMCAQQPQVLMHRDFHSANLLVLPDNQVGILDFQDVFMGPITYDLASLLRDCYIDWPEEAVRQRVLTYREKIKSTVSAEEFLRWFDWMGLQRHLKALLTFSRKYKRDHNASYLQFIPRTLKYILQTSASYAEFQWLNQFVSSEVMEKISCAQ